jgi:dCTP deaminase
MLTDSAIRQGLADGSIAIKPLNDADIGSNSVDLHLSPHLAVYEEELRELDCRKPNKLRRFVIPEPDGYVLQPGVLYLGSTIEYTESHKTIPFIEGKSSLGRLGVFVHATAGVGDVGFCNHWTLELTVCQPVRIYAGMPVAQIIYFEPRGTVDCVYTKKASAKYTEVSPLPKESLMHLNYSSPSRTSSPEAASSDAPPAPAGGAAPSQI